MARRKRSYREIRETAMRLRRTYGNSAVNQARITRAGRNTTKNLAKNLRLGDSNLLRSARYIDKRGFTTASRGLANG